MKRIKLTLGAIGAFLMIIASATTGNAAFRTFVAGPGIGDDTNSATGCSFSAPCRNPGTAYTVTDVGGEIVILTAGGYGGVTITHALTIQALPGQYAFFGVGAAGTAIVVGAGASESVVLRNLQFTGAPPLAAGSMGIQHNSGKLVIENCVFTALGTGIQVNNAKTDVVDCDILGNTIGISTTGTGYDPNCSIGGNNPFSGQWPGDAITAVRLEKGQLSNNTTGLRMVNPGTPHANCFCTPICSFPTPTPSLNPTQNLITMFTHNTDASTAGVTMNITGNTTFMTGTGASCTATPGMCQNPISYSGTANPR